MRGRPLPLPADFLQKGGQNPVPCAHALRRAAPRRPYADPARPGLSRRPARPRGLRRSAGARSYPAVQRLIQICSRPPPAHGPASAQTPTASAGAGRAGVLQHTTGPFDQRAGAKKGLLPLSHSYCFHFKQTFLALGFFWSVRSDIMVTFGRALLSGAGKTVPAPLFVRCLQAASCLIVSFCSPKLILAGCLLGSLGQGKDAGQDRGAFRTQAGPGRFCQKRFSFFSKTNYKEALCHA